MPLTGTGEPAGSDYAFLGLLRAIEGEEECNWVELRVSMKVTGVVRSRIHSGHVSGWGVGGRGSDQALLLS
jgi:hypothetical protein